MPGLPPVELSRCQYRFCFSPCCVVLATHLPSAICQCLCSQQALSQSNTGATKATRAPTSLPPRPCSPLPNAPATFAEDDALLPAVLAELPDPDELLVVWPEEAVDALVDLVFDAVFEPEPDVVAVAAVQQPRQPCIAQDTPFPSFPAHTWKALTSTPTLRALHDLKRPRSQRSLPTRQIAHPTSGAGCRHDKTGIACQCAVHEAVHRDAAGGLQGIILTCGVEGT